MQTVIKNMITRDEDDDNCDSQNYNINNQQFAKDNKNLIIITLHTL